MAPQARLVSPHLRPARSGPCRPPMPDAWPSVRAPTCRATPRSRGSSRSAAGWMPSPERRARLPFVGLREQLGAESEVPIALLHLMRKYRVARHTSTLRVGALPDLEGPPAGAVGRRRPRGPRAVPRPADALRPVRRGGRDRHLVPQSHRLRRAPLDAAARTRRAAGQGGGGRGGGRYALGLRRRAAADVSGGREHGARRRRVVVLHPAQQFARPPHPSRAAGRHRGPGAAWARNASGASPRGAPWTRWMR